MKRNGLRPDNVLTWLSLLGITCYVITWIGYNTFYHSFSVSPDAVGISYPALLIPTAVFFSLIVMLLGGVGALAAPFFMRVSIRAANLHWRFGLAFFVAFVVLSARIGPPPQEGVSPGRLIIALGGLFSISLFAIGIIVIGETRASNYLHRQRHLWSVRRLRRRVQPKCSVEEQQLEIRKYMATRRRRRSNRARMGKDLREAAPVALMLLLAITAFLVLSFVVYLSNSAEHAARDVVAGKRMFTSGGDFPAGILLNVRARAVEVLAVESRFRPLERQKLLYLGTKDGAYVLYDISKRKALVIPSGAIALQFN